eukprot:TRINITY_DN47654_c0_g1_i1.p1 TRINITY_DN47654_c0_g1~~TRINITY_DN47654_c0_g1_i1.p1  ORF type:complete len:369 (+),score=117.82 TRINITY_DN47654_c0_g1_i1:53-1108(+)
MPGLSAVCRLAAVVCAAAARGAAAAPDTCSGRGGVCDDCSVPAPELATAALRHALDGDRKDAADFAARSIACAPAGADGRAHAYELAKRLDGAGAAEAVRAVGVGAVARGFWRHWQQRVGYVVDVPSSPFPDPDAAEADAGHAGAVTRAAEQLAEAASAMSAEWAAFRAAGQRLSANAETGRLGGGQWREKPLLQEGVRADCGTFASTFPKTAAAMLRAAGPRMPKGYAGFSLLGAGGRIAPHCGPSNHRWRFHVGVTVPPDCADPETCGIRVANSSRGWKAGEVLLLDDSYEHTVWNSAGEDRVVGIVDVWNPYLTEEQRERVRDDFGFSKTEQTAKALWKKYRCRDTSK